MHFLTNNLGVNRLHVFRLAQAPPLVKACNVDVPSDDISQMSGGDEHSEHSSR